MNNVAIIYHGDCPDGFTAAWLIRRAHPEAVLIPAKYGEPVPELYGYVVFVVDFCYTPEQMDKLASCASLVRVLDHHQTARDQHWSYRWVVFKDNELPKPGNNWCGRFVAWFADKLSGAGMAAAYCEQLCGLATPEFVKYVQDRDLWEFSLPGTREISAYVRSLEHTVVGWNALASASREELLALGSGALAFADKLAQDCAASRETFLLLTPDSEVEVEMCNAPYAVGSDAAGIIANSSSSRMGGYYLRSGDVWAVGLRSAEDGPDVSSVAQSMGGGGHRHAAGFRADVLHYGPQTKSLVVSSKGD